MIQGNVAIKVSPEDLISKSKTVSTKLKTMQQLIDTIEKTVGHTKGYWLGEAAVVHRKMYEEEKATIVTIMKRLNEHPKDLIEIASEYTKAETAVKKIAQELPAAILS